MKKIVIAVIALLFLASVFVGFRAAARMNERLLKPGNQTGNFLAVSQQNYLIFHVSDLSSDSPFLVSVWGLFINHTPSPHLVFVPLYPPDGEGKDGGYSPAFRLRRDKTLPNRLISQFERESDIETSGYVLLDNFAVSSLEAWINQKSVKQPQQEALSKQEFLSILSNGEGFFSGFCDQANQFGLRPVLENIRWTELLPEHFSTNMSFEDMMLAVDKLTSAGKIQSCEVLTH